MSQARRGQWSKPTLPISAGWNGPNHTPLGCKASDYDAATPGGIGGGSEGQREEAGGYLYLLMHIF